MMKFIDRALDVAVVIVGVVIGAYVLWSGYVLIHLAAIMSGSTR